MISNLLLRRLGRGAHFDVTVAIEIVMLASSVISWRNNQEKLVSPYPR
jgi:hypothetical protein